MAVASLFVLLVVLNAAKTENKENKACLNSSPDRNCFHVGSLKGMLSFIRSVQHSLVELVETAKHKADVLEDGLCGNGQMNSTAAKDEWCIKAEPDCYALHSAGLRKSGVYRIWPKFLNHSVLVYCDMEKDNGGWTVIQRRGDYGDPPRSFYETWDNYKNGFGDLKQDFWLGNDIIFALTSQANMTLRIDLEDFEGAKRFAVYRNFIVRSERERYRMTFEGYEGNAGNSLNVHNGQNFITKDNGGGCAINFKGGWWYSNCHEANLNGIYHRGYHDSYADGINWFAFRGYNHSMKNAEMKIRPCGC